MSRFYAFFFFSNELSICSVRYWYGRQCDFSILFIVSFDRIENNGYGYAISGFVIFFFFIASSQTYIRSAIWIRRLVLGLFRHFPNTLIVALKHIWKPYTSTIIGRRYFGHIQFLVQILIKCVEHPRYFEYFRFVRIDFAQWFIAAYKYRLNNAPDI